MDTFQSLVHHDKSRCFHVMLRDISWHILGICQQMTGDLQSLSQIHHHRIQNATLMRMRVFKKRTRPYGNSSGHSLVITFDTLTHIIL